MDAFPNKGSLLRGIVFPNILFISLCHSCFYPDALCPSLQPKIKTHSLHKEVYATHVKGMSMYTKRLRALVSPLLYMTLENRCLGTAYTLSEKKKSVCRANSSTQHFWALGMWTFGRRERGKEEGRLLGRGKCVKEVKTVSRLQYLRFCHSNWWGTGYTGLVCTRWSVVSSFIVLFYGPNWRGQKWHWPSHHTSADSWNVLWKVGAMKKNCGWWIMTGFFLLHAQCL